MSICDRRSEGITHSNSKTPSTNDSIRSDVDSESDYESDTVGTEGEDGGTRVVLSPGSYSA